MKEILRILFAERKTTFWKVFLSVFLTGLLISSISEFYYYINREIELMSDKTRISVVFYNNTAESEINSTIQSLQQNDKIKTIEYISSEQAEFEFFRNYTSFSKELLTINPFPPVINFSMKKDYFNYKDIRTVVKKLSKNENIEEIKYKKDFLITFFSVKQNLFNYFYFLASLAGIMIIIIQYFSIRHNYLNLPDKVSDRIILADEETKPLTLTKYKTAVTIYIFLVILLSMFVSSIIFVNLWWFLKDIVLWIGIMNIRRLLLSLFVTCGLMLYISILIAMIVKRKI
ncbi:MAG: permease-like cell division protein FtsX [bacterium]